MHAHKRNAYICFLKQEASVNREDISAILPLLSNISKFQGSLV